MKARLFEGLKARRHLGRRQRSFSRVDRPEKGWWVHLLWRGITADLGLRLADGKSCLDCIAACYAPPPRVKEESWLSGRSWCATSAADRPCRASHSRSDDGACRRTTARSISRNSRQVRGLPTEVAVVVLLSLPPPSVGDDPRSLLPPRRNDGGGRRRRPLLPSAWDGLGRPRRQLLPLQRLRPARADPLTSEVRLMAGRWGGADSRMI